MKEVKKGEEGKPYLRPPMTAAPLDPLLVQICHSSNVPEGEKRGRDITDLNLRGEERKRGTPTSRKEEGRRGTANEERKREIQEG